MTGYELRCRKCGYGLHFSRGILMSFQKTNRELWENMKNGKLGEDFKKAVREHPEAEAYHSNELYICPDCGELFGQRAIELRGADNRVLVSVEHVCNKCGSGLELVSGEREYRESGLCCPRCKAGIDSFCPDVRIFAD